MDTPFQWRNGWPRHIVQLDTHGGYWCGLSQGALRLSRSHRFREDFPARQPVRAAATDQVSLLSVMVQAYTAMEGLMRHGEDALERAERRLQTACARW